MTPGPYTRRPATRAPVACRLTPAGLAAQAGRWTRLIAMALTGRTETADGVRLSFRPGPGTVEELRALAAVETECCPWAEWTVDTSAEAVVLDVRAGAAGLGTLRAMFGPVSAP